MLLLDRVGCGWDIFRVCLLCVLGLCSMAPQVLGICSGISEVATHRSKHFRHSLYDFARLLRLLLAAAKLNNHQLAAHVRSHVLRFPICEICEIFDVQDSTVADWRVLV